MSEEPGKGIDREGRVQLLMKETGIAEAEASDLITMLGTNRSSLVREARVIAKRLSGRSNAPENRAESRLSARLSTLPPDRAYLRPG
jgi:hypothetical protein